MKLQFPNPIKTQSVNIDDNVKKYDISSLEYKEGEINKNIANFIKSEINSTFNINDYIIEGSSEVIRFVYAPNQVKTENSYTAFVKEGKVKKLFSYISEDFNSLNEKISKVKKLTLVQEQEIKNEIVSKSNESEKYIIDGENYWFKNDKLEYDVLYNIETEKGIYAENVTHIVE